MKDKQYVLIVCVGNLATFHIVEGLLCHEVGNWCEVFSAGNQDNLVSPETSSIMEEIGIDVSRLRSHAINEVTGQEFDYVICVGPNEQACPNVSGNPHRLYWSVQDTAPTGWITGKATGSVPGDPGSNSRSHHDSCRRYCLFHVDQPS
jgi:protein-tyrosine-phosphatase